MRGRARRKGVPGPRTARVLAALLGLGWAAAACGPGERDPGQASAEAAAERSGPAYPLPAGAPARFGFGAPASDARVARWDHDVRPDGAGLPPGSGSVEAGARVFAAHCAPCHGATGVEGPNDRLVGREPSGFPFGSQRGLLGERTVGNYWPYATTLFDYITRAMPQNAPGSLTADERYAVIAWILNRNGIVGADAVLDARTLPQVRMPARDRFVSDDRRGGPEVR